MEIETVTRDSSEASETMKAGARLSITEGLNLLNITKYSVNSSVAFGIMSVALLDQAMTIYL